MVQAQIKQKFEVLFQARRHQRISDVQPQLGGDDAAPTPHELLEAALAACTTMTVQMYAQRKGWPLRTAHVQTRIRQETPEVLIEVEIEFEGDLSLEQKRRLFEIACRCPIHRILERKISIENKWIQNQEEK